jgi:hypothetical protein
VTGTRSAADGVPVACKDRGVGNDDRPSSTLDGGRTLAGRSTDALVDSPALVAQLTDVGSPGCPAG